MVGGRGGITLANGGLESFRDLGPAAQYAAATEHCFGSASSRASICLEWRKKGGEKKNPRRSQRSVGNPRTLKQTLRDVNVNVSRRLGRTQCGRVCISDLKGYGGKCCICAFEAQSCSIVNYLMLFKNFIVIMSHNEILWCLLAYKQIEKK